MVITDIIHPGISHTITAHIGDPGGDIAQTTGSVVNITMTADMIAMSARAVISVAMLEMMKKSVAGKMMLAMTTPHRSAAMFLQRQPGTPVSREWSSGIANPRKSVKANLNPLKPRHRNLSVWFHQPPVLPCTHLQDQREVHFPGVAVDQIQAGHHPETSHPQAVSHQVVEIVINRFAICRAQ